MKIGYCRSRFEGYLGNVGLDYVDWENSKLSKKILQSCILLCFIGLLRVFYNYNVGNVKEFPSFQILFLLGLALLLLLVLKHLPSHAKKAVILVGSVYIAALVAEIHVAMLYPAPIRKLLVENGIAFDARRSVDVAMELRSKGLDAYFFTRPFPFLQNVGAPKIAGRTILPLNSVPLKITAGCAEEGHHTVFTTDRYGFNNSDTVWDKPINVMLIGDSYAEGQCVDQALNIASVMSRGGINTASLGMGGSGPLTELAIFRNIASFFRPPTILWLFFEGNDLEDLNKEMGYTHLYEELVPLQHSTEYMSVKPLIDEWIQDWQDKFIADQSQLWEQFFRAAVLRDLRARIRARLEALSAQATSQTSDYDMLAHRFEKTIDVVRKEMKEWGGKLIIVYLPSPNRYTGKSVHFRKIQDLVTAAAANAGVAVVDISNSMQQKIRPTDLYAKPGRVYGHFNPDGYRFAAGEIISYLSKGKK